MATYATLNNSLQAKCGAQLRTFDKTVTWTCQATVQNGQSGTTRRDQALYQRFEFVNATDGLYNNYLDSGIYSGQIIYQQDVIDSITSVVRRTVDLIEGRMGNRSVNFSICHASCHTSCHTSRGRR